jgi:hypothetical protein
MTKNAHELQLNTLVPTGGRCWQYQNEAALHSHNFNLLTVDSSMLSAATKCYVIFEVLKAMFLKIQAFWDLTFSRLMTYIDVVPHR